MDLLRGLALQTGVDCLSIPGVTDGGDNDYEAQIEGALAALDDHDVVFVHVEAPDEASHAGDVVRKLRALEQIDALMIPQVIAMQEQWARERIQTHPTAEEPAVSSGMHRTAVRRSRRDRVVGDVGPSDWWNSRPTWPNRCRL